jgi:hypothetical protein
MARNRQHRVKHTIALAVDLAAGPGTARTIAGKAKQLAGATAAHIAQTAARTAVRLEVEGKADTMAGYLQAEAAGALKRARARLKSTDQGNMGTAQPGAKK